jgi:uncharacterized protein (DUF983 family)
MSKSLIQSIFSYTCPRCREGKLFKNKSMFPMKEMLDMPKRCAVCNQATELETGFYFGTGYVSYAMSIALMVSWFTAYLVLIGISWKDNSVFWALGSGILFLVIMQPILMRLSRSVYIHIFVPYDKSKESKK